MRRLAESTLAARGRRAGIALALLSGAAFLAGMLAGTRHGPDVALAARGGPVTLVWGGDVTLGSSYGFPPGRGWPQLAPVASVLAEADLAAVNLEGTFGPGGGSKCAGSHSSTCFAFQAPRANARTLRRAGVDVVNTANNHADAGGAAERLMRGLSRGDFGDRSPWVASVGRIMPSGAGLGG